MDDIYVIMYIGERPQKFIFEGVCEVVRDEASVTLKRMAGRDIVLNFGSVLALGGKEIEGLLCD